MVRAAVLTGVNEKFEVRDDVEVQAPRAGEVKVRMGASGVCHSDLSIQNGTMASPFPVVCGHEGSAIVEEVGEGVTVVKPGDHVVLSWVPECGECFFCMRGQGSLCERATMALLAGGMLDGSKRMSSRGQELSQMAALGSFSESSVVPQTSVVKIDDDVDLKVAALIGCGVLTGTGAALNTARIAKGDTVAVVGCGGVGLNVIQGAVIAGAERVIAVDVVPGKLELAKTFGATEAVNAGEGDPVGQVQALTQGRGADVSFEVIGLEQTIQQTIDMARRGGQAILVGVPRAEVAVNVPAFFGIVFNEKTIKGSWYGSSNVQQDVPKLVGLYKSGKLKLDELISRTVSLDEINDAFAALESGEVARSVIAY